MSKLRDMVINIIPQLDVRKAQMMGKKLGDVMKRTIGGIKNAASFGGKAATGLNQGLQLLQQIKGVLAQTNGEVEKSINFADELVDMASAAGSSVKNISGLVLALSETSAEKNTLGLLEKFMQRAGSNGFTGDMANNMVEALMQINAAATIEEKLKLGEKHFGTRNWKDLQDALAGVENWEANLKKNRDMAIKSQVAAMSGEAAASKIEQQNTQAKYRKLTVAEAKGFIDAAVTANQITQDAGVQKLKDDQVRADTLIKNAQLMSQVDVWMNKLMNFGANAVTDLIAGIKEIASNIQKVQEAKGKIKSVVDTAANLVTGGRKKKGSSE